MGWLDDFRKPADIQELVNYWRIVNKVCPSLTDKNERKKCQEIYENLLKKKLFSLEDKYKN